MQNVKMLFLSGLLVFSSNTYSDVKEGPVGGIGGKPFERALAADEKVCGVNTYSKSRINAIQLRICDSNGNVYYSELFGSRTGTFTSSVFEPNEIIWGVWVNAYRVINSQRVVGLTILTDRNSYYFGNDTYEFVSTLDIMDGYEFGGIFGRSGDELDALGFIYRKEKQN